MASIQFMHTRSYGAHMHVLVLRAPFFIQPF